MLRNDRRNPFLVWAFSLSLLAALVSPAASQETPVDPEAIERLLEGKLQQRFVPGEVIVKMKEPVEGTEPIPNALLNRLNLGPEARVTSGGEFIYRMQPALMGTLAAADLNARTLSTAQELQADPNVEYAQPNYILQIVTEPDDTHYPKQWHYRDNGSSPGQSRGGIGLPTTWDTNQGDPSVVVAVIDTGILPNHQDISGSPNLVAGYDMISEICAGGTCVANDGDGRDADPTDPGDAVSANECMVFGSPPHQAQIDSWHGTHVAGTVGVGNTNNNLGVAGMNWQVKVQAVRVLGKCGGTTADISDGIRWAAGLPVPGVPTNTTPAKIINLSLGGPGACANSPAQQNAINDAVAAGVTVVVAAGNDAQDASGYHPASCNNVITVAASDARGRLVTRYSNFGATVEILAPGGDVQRDDNNDGRPDGVLSMVHASSPLSSFSGGYAFYNGTSMAAPHVAGAAALLLAEDPSLSPTEVLDALQARAIPRNSSECPKPCGEGLLSTLPPALRLTLDTANIKLKNPGDTRSLEATVSKGGQPVSGATVEFTSNDTGVATVAPTTASTDGTGKASTTVTAQAKDETTIDVEAEKDGEQDAKNVRVKVPIGSLWGVMLLTLITLLILYRRVGQERGI